MGYLESLVIPTLVTFFIIYFWLKIFHEYGDKLRILIAAFIANFQNYVIPLVLGLSLRLGLLIPYPFYVVPAVFWILLIKLFFRWVSWSHAIFIGVLCFATHMILETIDILTIFRLSLNMKF